MCARECIGGYERLKRYMESERVYVWWVGELARVGGYVGE